MSTEKVYVQLPPMTSQELSVLSGCAAIGFSILMRNGLGLKEMLLVDILRAAPSATTEAYQSFMHEVELLSRSAFGDEAMDEARKLNEQLLEDAATSLMHPPIDPKELH